MTPSARLKTRPKPDTPRNGWRFSAIGTQWWIGIFEPVDAVKLKALRHRVDERIERFDKTYSRFREDSLVTQISGRAGTYTFPADSHELFTYYRRLYDATGGAVTPLIGDMLVAAGYDAAYSFKSGELRPLSTWDEVLAYDDGILTVKKPTMLDFGAAGKGYLVDLVAELLEGEGVSQFCVDAGGDMLVRGNEAFSIGLEHPDNAQQIIGVAQLYNRAIAGSAPNRRVWSGYHHIMDPFALRSSSGLKAAWAVAESVLVADSMATALFFVPPEHLSQFDFEYLLVNDKNQYRHSPDFPAELFKVVET